MKASLRNFWQPGKTLRDYLAQVTLDKEDNDDDVENKPGVCLITMHAAKGLEFPVVYLVGLGRRHPASQAFPGRRQL